MTRSTDHQRAVDIEHKLKVAASQAREDVHSGVIILAMRVLEQQSALPSTATGSRPNDDDADVQLTSVEATALARHDRKARHAQRLMDDLHAAIDALDQLRETSHLLCSGLDAGTYQRRCPDGYAKACRDRDMVDPKPSGGGACDACRKARERDRDERRNLSA